MDIADRVAQQSYAERAKVGAVMVKDNNIIAFGYNGTPSGWDNQCEDVNNETLADVLHAESNLIAKLAFSPRSSADSTVYVTLSPCHHCAKQLYQARIARIVYKEEYRDTSGLEFLAKAGVMVQQFNPRGEKDERTKSN